MEKYRPISFQRVFDPVENEILLAKLKAVGEGPARSWFRCRQETESKTLSVIRGYKWKVYVKGELSQRLCS